MSDYKNENEETSNELDDEIARLPGQYPMCPRVFNDRQKQIYRKVIRSKPWDWFDSGNMPLLINYCLTIYHLEMLEPKIEEIYTEPCGFDVRTYKSLLSIRAQLQGKLSDLATRMRLTQQSIYDERTAANKNKGAGTGEGDGKPWETPAQKPDKKLYN